MDEETIEIAQALANVDALHQEACKHMQEGRPKVAAALFDELAKDCRAVAKKARQTKR